MAKKRTHLKVKPMIKHSKTYPYLLRVKTKFKTLAIFSTFPLQLKIVKPNSKQPCISKPNSKISLPTCLSPPTHNNKPLSNLLLVQLQFQVWLQMTQWLNLANLWIVWIPTTPPKPTTSRPTNQIRCSRISSHNRWCLCISSSSSCRHKIIRLQQINCPKMFKIHLWPLNSCQCNSRWAGEVIRSLQIWWWLRRIRAWATQIRTICKIRTRRPKTCQINTNKWQVRQSNRGQTMASNSDLTLREPTRSLKCRKTATSKICSKEVKRR